MLKKIKFLLICSFWLTACSLSGNQFVPAQVVTSTSTPVLPPTSTYTIIPTQPTSTFTLTPTLVGYKSPTPTLADTPTATLDTLSTFAPTPVVKMNGFISAKTSAAVFYKSAGCGPTSVKFIALTSNLSNAEFVVLSTRFVSRTSGVKSKWEGITMKSDGLGLFTYELSPQQMKSVDAFVDPWVQFQFVATDNQSAEVGRTDVFDEQLSLLACVLTPTPTITVTPTVLKP